MNFTFGSFFGMEMLQRFIIWTVIAIMIGIVAINMVNNYTGFYTKMRMRQAVVSLESKLSQDYASYLSDNAGTIQACIETKAYSTVPITDVFNSCISYDKDTFRSRVSLTPIETEVLDNYCDVKVYYNGAMLKCSKIP